MSERPITTTLQALIDEEQERTASAQKRLGSFVPLVQSGIALLNTMVATVDRVLQELNRLDRDVNNHRDILARSMGMGHILRK